MFDLITAPIVIPELWVIPIVGLLIGAKIAIALHNKTNHNLSLLFLLFSAIAAMIVSVVYLVLNEATPLTLLPADLTDVDKITIVVIQLGFLVLFWLPLTQGMNKQNDLRIEQGLSNNPRDRQTDENQTTATEDSETNMYSGW